jgi:poly(3-hydroxybutyrate) depolymerase
MHYEAQGAGHYGIFSGRRWRDMVHPVVKTFIRAHQPAADAAPAAAKPAVKAAPKAVARKPAAKASAAPRKTASRKTAKT